MLDHFRIFARYNAWANGLLYDAAAALDEADYSRDLGAAFGSLRGTLNHLLVGDLLWMARFEGAPAPAPALALDQTLHAGLEDLRRARAAEDARIIAYADGLSAEALDAEIVYDRVSAQERVRQPLRDALAHFFNHQTHHRGQAHALLTRMTGRAPSMDLLFFQRAANLAKG